ncbi:MAG: YdgA family protein [Oscillospiraceae bacterium]|nr:YdgA family protein [Oscillospiraceae bacterium]
MANTNKKGMGLNLTVGLITCVLTLLSLVLYLLSHTTNYYIFGQMNSGAITALLVGTMIAELLTVFCEKRFPKAVWAKCLTFLVTALLVGTAILMVGDRVEGIGNCIVTDYDAGHGGEEAIYMSLISAGLLLVATVYNIIGAFAEDGNAVPGKGKIYGLAGSAAALGLAALIGGISLGGVLAPSAAPGAAGTDRSGTYTISFNQEYGNIEGMPDYQFLSANMESLLKYDARSYIDVTLKLDNAGAYSLISDYYVVDSGKRAEIGDPSGLGLVYRTTSEGSYTANEDGSVVTSVPTHVFFELATDTYSEQMKQMMHVDLGGSDADGNYDSADYPELLDYVPETTWTLGDGTILGYGKGALSGTFTLSYNQENGNIEGMPDYQFLSADMGSLLKYDARSYLDVSLTLDGVDQYSLISDFYVVDSGKRAEIGDPSGLGIVYRTTSEGSYMENEDGTVTTAPATHVYFELATDTYSEQMKQMMQIDLDGSDADGNYDSADYPVLLDYVPETVWTLSGAEIVSYAKTEVEEEEPSEEAPATEGVTVASDDGATTLTFNADGTYRFFFESYNIEDLGSYTYEGGVLTLTNPNGATFTADGDPMKLHYVSAVSDQVAGDFTIPADTFGAAPAETPAAEGVTVSSDDGATTLTFNPDGTYRFFFESYNIEDLGSYTYEGGVLTLTNPNGATFTAEGETLKLHYVSAVSDQVTGDFTIPAATFGAAPAQTPTAEGVTVASDDGATTLTFNADGTYRFFFESYSIEDLGSYTFEGGVLTLTNANGATFTAEGETMKLHYVTAVSDQLAGDFTIQASLLG